jgi:hypothetical protein
LAFILEQQKDISPQMYCSCDPPGSSQEVEDQPILGWRRGPLPATPSLFRRITKRFRVSPRGGRIDAPHGNFRNPNLIISGRIAKLCQGVG